MSWWELLVLSVALAMDALAVSVSSGMVMKKPAAQGLKMAGTFGVFQGIMPLLGYTVALTFADKIRAVDHWVAFILLAFVGGKALFEAFRGGEEEEPADPTRLKNLLLMAVATSIDALAVGASFSMMDKTGVLALSMGSLIACAVIAVVTFIICMTGVWIRISVNTSGRIRRAGAGGDQYEKNGNRGGLRRRRGACRTVGAGMRLGAHAAQVEGAELC